MDTIKRTKNEIKAVLDKAHEYVDTESKFWGMNYEEGLVVMYDWLTADEPEDAPMDG